MVDPSERPSISLNHSKPMKQAISRGDNRIIIEYDYSFAPYSIAKDKLLVDYFVNGTDQLFAEYRINQEGVWERAQNEKAVCR